MVATIGNTSSREGRKGRPILSLERIEAAPTECAQVATNEPASDSTDNSSDQFEAEIWADRNAWDIRRRTLSDDADAWLRGGGFAGRGKLSKADADTLLKRGLAAVDGSK